MVQIVYSNHRCADVFSIFIKNIRKYSKLPIFVISDFDVSHYDVDGHHQYEESQPYYSVWSEALGKFGGQNFIYLQEDFFLYGDVAQSILEKYRDFLNCSNYSFVRLLKSGQLRDKRVFENLFEIESSNQDIFSMQASIWKTRDYLALMDRTRENKWLEEPSYRREMISLGMNGLYHYDGERKIGQAHHDSKVYPYIATAVVKGKWNFLEYGEILAPMLMEAGINPIERGIF